MTEASVDAHPDGATESTMSPEELEELETIVDAIQSVPQMDDVTNVDGTLGVSSEAMEEHDVSAPGGKLAPYSLPGFGDGPMQDYCGDKQTHFCDECGETFDQSRRCSQNRCPECWEAWVIGQAETITQKVDTAARTNAARTGEAHHKHHVAIMLPEDWRPAGTPEERMENTKGVIKTIIKDAWDAEGVALYHGWSGSGYGAEEEVAPGVDDRGEWPDRLDPKNRDWEGDVRDELHARPHFHAVVTAPRIEGGAITSEVHERTGWVIKRIADEESGRSITGRDSDGEPSEDGEMRALAQVVTYALSHNSIDTTGDQNQAVQVRVGSSFHTADVRGHVERSAVRAVRAVAPTTLGIPESRLSCDGMVAPAFAWDDMDSHHTHDHDDGSEDGLEEGDGDADPEPEADTTVDDVRVDCQGASRHISEAAQFVSSSTWTDRAQFAQETIEAFEETDGAPPP